MTSKEALEILKHSGLGYTPNQFEVAMTVVEKDLKILEILKGLFLGRVGLDVPYYDLNNRICVDTSMFATPEEIELVKEWLLEDNK